jgi:methionyl aminopeptidase
MSNKTLVNAIKSANVHKKTNYYIRDLIKPGITLKEIANLIENKVKEEIAFDIENPSQKGIAFPVGLSLNNCAAHYTPNYYDADIILKESDILKVDYGVHIEGTIIDSAFTIHFDPKYDEFVKLSKDLTNYAVSLCRPDVILGELGADIEEYIKSKELIIDGKLCKMNVMSEISGHMISQYQIHAGKAVPNVAINYNVRMKEYEYYAIEPFLTTGLGKSIIKGDNSHFMLSNSLNNLNKLKSDEKKLYHLIYKNFNTLPFCQKWLYQLNKELEHDKLLKKLEEKQILNVYPPIWDIEGSIISQFEHTIFVKENGIINLTANNYY